MKYCPVCKIDYADSAEFCKKCEAHLLEKVDKPEKVKTDPKRLLLMCLYTGGFILFVMLLYFILAGFMK
jgi:predicted amidophosphoribosyltransferase